ncbi:MAG: cytochrome-c oxidase, cbb3-type subunit III [Nevskiales bacterium]|nr:cytochrome-c oxidase, cbb3-type subunit III [Nevskiales bacterium]
MSAFWSWFVIAITVMSMIGALWLLFSNAKGKMTTEDTGHVWDGDLREYNNPLPRWWLNLFVLTVVFAVVYLAVYPGLGNFGGQFGWTSDKQLQERLEKVEAKREAIFAQFGDQGPAELSKNPAALSLGKDVFLNNCAGCHGADAKGAIGFPNLTDNDWLYGGSPETIVASITNGRTGIMPPLGATMDKDTLEALVKTVAHWGDPSLDPAVREKGMAQFNTTCMACHGPDGKGNPMLGAPNLTDNVWLYGGTTDRIRQTLVNGRQGKMPAHQPLLSKDEIKVVAAYVYSLSH